MRTLCAMRMPLNIYSKPSNMQFIDLRIQKTYSVSIWRCFISFRFESELFKLLDARTCSQCPFQVVMSILCTDWSNLIKPFRAARRKHRVLKRKSEFIVVTILIKRNNTIPKHIYIYIVNDETETEAYHVVLRFELA